MKITDVSVRKYFFVETDDGDFRRSYNNRNWEGRFGESWEPIYLDEILEGLFQEYYGNNLIFESGICMMNSGLGQRWRE